MTSETTCETNFTPQPSKAKWTKRDYVNVLLAMLIKFGDGVEIYLPGVIVQTVSCELGVSFFQEGILAVVFYLVQSVAQMSAVPLAKRFGDKFTLLFSLYSSIIFTVVCALVPNYYTLLLARALIGLGCGLNSSTVGVFGAKNVSSKEILPTFSFLHGSIAFTLGGGWASLMGWLLLESIGWRVFVLLTSIPWFIPPIIILHCCILDENSTSESTNLLKEKAEIETELDENFTEKVIKGSFFMGLCSWVGHGSIMLLPSLIRGHNLENDSLNFGKCAKVVHGDQFLILAAVTGLASFVGRPIGFIIRQHVRFWALQSVLMICGVISSGIILTKPGLLVESVMMGLIKFINSVQMMEVIILNFDADYFGHPGLALGSAIMQVTASFGCVISSALAVFTNPYHAVLAVLVVNLAQIIVICSMKERR